MNFRSKGKLETGHGPIKAAWVKFGKVLNAMIEIGNWLNTHPTEIVVIYFGNMFGNIAEGQKEVRTIVKTVFNQCKGFLSHLYNNIINIPQSTLCHA